MYYYLSCLFSVFPLFVIIYYSFFYFFQNVWNYDHRKVPLAFGPASRKHQIGWIFHTDSDPKYTDNGLGLELGLHLGKCNIDLLYQIFLYERWSKWFWLETGGKNNTFFWSNSDCPLLGTLTPPRVANRSRDGKLWINRYRTTIPDFPSKYGTKEMTGGSRLHSIVVMGLMGGLPCSTNILCRIFRRR